MSRIKERSEKQRTFEIKYESKFTWIHQDWKQITQSWWCLLTNRLSLRLCLVKDLYLSKNELECVAFEWLIDVFGEPCNVFNRKSLLACLRCFFACRAESEELARARDSVDRSVTDLIRSKGVKPLKKNCKLTSVHVTHLKRNQASFLTSAIGLFS